MAQDRGRGSGLQGDATISITGRGDALAAPDRPMRLLLLALWIALSGYLAVRHVVWRDEMRALSLALFGDSVGDMLRAIHGEGHPAIWYLMLRGAYTLVPVREVLPVLGWLSAAAAAVLFAWRAPFRPLTLALVLFSAFFAFEYAAVARNYGIGMLAMFGVAAAYPAWRDRGVAVGLLLAVLCNTNVPCCVLAALLLGFWLVELIGEEGLRWGPKYRIFILNALVAAAGAGLCFATVFPTVHDAAVIEHPGGVGPLAVLKALFTPASSFGELVPPVIPTNEATAALFGVLVFGAVLSLIRAPGAFLAGLAALFAFELFFQFVYPGYYRHQALLLCFLVSLHWLVAKGRGGLWPEAWRIAERTERIAAAGEAMFLVLLFLQVLITLTFLSTEAAGYPFSRARDLGRLVREQGLEGAPIMADPDVVAEAFPYYLPRNPVWMPRARRFATVVRFTKDDRRVLTPDDYLADARALKVRTGRPVLIVLQNRLSADRATRTKEAYVWVFETTPDQVRRFEAATQRLARFGPAVTDESYDVYVLR